MKLVREEAKPRMPYLRGLQGVFFLRLLCIGLGVIGILVGTLQSLASLIDQIAGMIDFITYAALSLQCQFSLLRGLLHIRLESRQCIVCVVGILQCIVSLLHRLGGTLESSLSALQQLNVFLLLGVGAAWKTFSLEIILQRVLGITYRFNRTLASWLSASNSPKSSPLLSDNSLIFFSSSSARSLAATASFFS